MYVSALQIAQIAMYTLQSCGYMPLHTKRGSQYLCVCIGKLSQLSDLKPNIVIPCNRRQRPPLNTHTCSSAHCTI